MYTWSGGEKPPRLVEKPPGGEIQPGEAHVWWLRPPQNAKFPVLEQFSLLVSDPEWQRAKRFHFAADAWSYLSAQALLRWALAEQLRCRPTELRFRRTEYGRPFLDSHDPELFFSVTHARGLVACAIAREKAIGVDVESPDQHIETVKLAEHYFAASELRHLRTLSGPDRVCHFFVQWTLKEAFLKAIGMGLHAPVDTLCVIPGQQDLKTNFAHSFPERTEGWGFWALAGWQDHHLAVAMRSNAPNILIRLRLAPQLWNVML